MKQRLHYIDIAKGLTLLLMMFSHIETLPEFLAAPIGAFCIPMFFFLSGYTFDSALSKSFKELIIKLFKRLVIPFALICLACALSECALFGGLERFGEFYHKMFFNYRVSNAWFIPSLVFVEIMYYAARKLLPDKLSQIVFVAASIGGFVFAYINGPQSAMLFNFDASLIGLSFFHAGKMINTYRQDLKIVHKDWTAVIMIAISFILSNINAFMDEVDTFICMFGNYYGFIPLYFVASIIGVFGILLLSECIEESETLEWFGRNTLYIASMHLTLTTLLKAKMFNVFTMIYGISPIAYWMFEFTLMVLLGVASSFVLQKIYNASMKLLGKIF